MSKPISSQKIDAVALLETWAYGKLQPKRTASTQSLYNNGLIKDLGGEYHLTQRGEDTVSFILEEIDKMDISINETIKIITKEEKESIARS